ncbi:hypothetical protein ACSQ67_025334 [Phaseolus vulgaris]
MHDSCGARQGRATMTSHDEFGLSGERTLSKRRPILTNGMYKSHIHRVIIGNNKVQRISLIGIHGPSLDRLISLSTKFVDEKHPKQYREMTFKEFVEVNGDDEVDPKSSLEQARLV